MILTESCRSPSSSMARASLPDDSKLDLAECIDGLELSPSRGRAVVATRWPSPHGRTLSAGECLLPPAPWIGLPSNASADPTPKVHLGGNRRFPPHSVGCGNVPSMSSAVF